MAERTSTAPEEPESGNRRIAAMLLETLTLRGRLADRERAERASGLEAADWLDPAVRLDDEGVARMLSAGAVEGPVARALGHRLVAPEATGLSLYLLGLATPEKAYRRLQALLPREAPAAHWLTEEIEDQAAWVSYRPAPSSPSGPDRRAAAVPTTPAARASCALRRGMLEAIPTLYGLLPAAVHDVQCVSRGDSVCRYRVEWRRNATRGRWLGLGFGVLLGGAAGLATALFSTVAAGFLVALLVLGFAAVVGTGLDLSRQLAAVGGTRRGQLALLEQVDDRLASRLDALARADAKLDEAPSSFRVGLERSHCEAGDPSLGRFSEAGPPEAARSVLAAAHAIHAAAGDLECWFDRQVDAGDAGGPSTVGEERAHVREIRDWAIRIADEVAEPGARPRRLLDLEALVRRGVASVRPLLPSSAVIDLEVDEDLEPIACEPVQIEQVVIQLVRNAIEASEAILDTPMAKVTLRNVRAGVEIGVEDRGAGIESSAVDEVFDPFFSEAPLGASGGFGLPICLRIVEAHGGELRIEAEDRPGTRVSIFLPHLAANRDSRVVTDGQAEAH